MSEIEAFPRAVLKHHYPEVPLHGDFTTIQAGNYEPIDALVGGTPCQSFSVAGLRGGMADERGNLALEYLRLAERLRPRWLCWENVPGVLSSSGGRDFGSFLGGMVQLGYGFTYRVLDAQYFGLAQRRKRVFVVGYLGDWRRAAAVLFEPASLRWHPAPRRETREKVAASLTRGADSGGKSGYAGRRREDDVNLVANPLGAKRDGGWRGDLDNDTYVSMSLNAHGGSGRMDGESETFVTAPTLTGTNMHDGQDGREDRYVVTHSLRADGFDASEDGTGRGMPLVATAFNHKASAHQSMSPGLISPTLEVRKSDGVCVAFQTSQSGVRDNETHATLDADNSSRRHNGAVVGSTVRRLTPRECERLQGFPDGYTDVPYRGKPAVDGPRYRALGNSMAVPCMSWIGQRMAMVDSSQ